MFLHPFFKLKNLVKEPTCYKNPENLNYIDLFLTNCARSFYSTCVFETGLFDFHKLVLTILRWKFKTLPPKIIRCRTYKQFDEEQFKAVFQNCFNEMNSSDLNVEVFKMLFSNALNKFAPVRKNTFVLFNLDLLTKSLVKELMHITKTTQARLAYNK